MSSLILATDVSYPSAGGAIVAGGLFKDWSSLSFEKSLIHKVSAVLPYEPGAFYKREMPLILGLVSMLDEKLRAIVIDGYCTLGRNAANGMGGHLFDALDGLIPVVGVAKTKYKDTPTDRELYRGNSSRPLFITAKGIGQTTAMNAIASMSGNYRMPKLLQEIDRISRE
ncbi:endonuclease V [Yoonia sp. 2307UL14-13]|uniref:endonuclease V n=1 Tax=Yoonia sp. 2307UL14-13 TaxID=3126506 RepID=UPI0030AF90DC